MQSTPELTQQRELRYLLRARHTLLWVVSHEERRAETAIATAAAPAGYQTRCWDCASGLTNLTGSPVELGAAAGGLPPTSPHAVLAHIRGGKAKSGEPLPKTVWILRDLHDWLGDPILLRALRTAARELQETQEPERLSAIVLLSPSAEVPLTLRNTAVVTDWPLPNREEIGSTIDDVLERLPSAVLVGDREQFIDAAAGLSLEQIESAISRSIVQNQGRIEPTLVATEKKRVIDRERVLTWYPPDPRGLGAVGGLNRLKRWLEERKCALSPAARAYRLPPPKGVLLVGVPGCGKSLMAKAVPTAWQLPLLRIDMGALKGSHVGQSEANIRRAIKIAEACAPVVLWIDEIEKALAGAASSGDSGVAADQLGTLLTWLQERAGLVFVVATANDTSALPPELTRKGRFDEIFFVDLPTRSERAAVLAAAIAQHGRDAGAFDLDAVAAITGDFSGAEVAELVPTALFRAFADHGREPGLDDLVLAAKQTVPAARASSPRLEALRAWAAERAQRASDPEDEAGPLPANGSTSRFAHLTPEELPS